MTILKRAFACAGVMVALAACEHGDPVSTAGGTLGHAVLINAAEGKPLSSKLPGGTANVTTAYSGFTTAVQDAFGRKQPDATRARRTRNFRSTAHYWTWTHEFRDASSVRKDPRLPVPNSGYVVDGNQYFELYQPEGSYPNKEFWEFYVELYGIKPSTTHEIAFVHRRLKVNGELDASERILTGNVTAPDELLLQPGTKRTISSDWSSASPANCDPFPGPTTNPFIWSTDASDAAGDLVIDKCVKSGNGIWTKPEFDTPTKSLVGRADDVTYDLPNYNYIEVWEGAFGTGKLVGRAQIAQDLSPVGKPIANAYPPFPSPGGVRINSQMGPPPAVDLATAYPITDALKATLPGAIGVPTSVVATLTNLQRLEAPVYKAFFMNSHTGVAKPAVGTYVRTVNGTAVENVASTSTFKGGPGTITFTAAYNPAVQGPYSDSLTFLVITKETDPATTTPSISQPLWVKIFKLPPASAGGAVTFGNFNREADSLAADTARKAVVFTPQGTATGGVIGDTVTVLTQSGGVTLREPVFVGSVLELKFVGLQRPPKGYEYLAYLRQKRVVSTATPPVVTRDSALVYIGGITGPDGSSLSNADVAPNGGNLGPQGISLALLRFDAHAIGAQLCDFDEFRLYVVPKGGTVSEPLAMVFQIKMPDRVLLDAKSCR